MDYLKAIVLGLVQGLTEFLPVSSSGHLVIAQKLMNFSEASLATDAILHLGTLGAVILYFRAELGVVLGSAWNWLRWRQRDENLRLVVFLAVGSVPAAAAGVAFDKLFEQAFASVMVVGLMLITTGVLLWLVDGRSDGARSLQSMRLSDSVWVGLAQMAAIMPGLSRSGATIAAGIWRGLERAEAAKFSFLLSVPIIMGASAFSTLRDGFAIPDPQIVAVATLTAGVSGFAAITLLMKIIKAQRLRLFAVYCFIMGSLALALAALG